MRRGTVWTLVVLVILAVVIVYSSLFEGQVECEVCVTYNGQTRCATAAAPGRDEAQASATTAACATLVRGRAEALECERVPPDRVSCSE